MTIAAPSIFPFRHDWAVPFQVTRTWKTDIQTTDQGKEVRVSLRSTPNISITMQVVTPDERNAGRLLATWRTATQPLRYYAPLWCDASELTTAITAGDSTIHCDTTTRPFFVDGGYAMVFQDEAHAEVVTIDTVSSSSFTLTGTAANSYPLVRTRVVPCRIMYLSMPIDVAWLGARVLSAPLSFVDEKAQAGYTLTDSADSPVADSILIYMHSHGMSGHGGQVGNPRLYYAEAVVLDAGEIPIPDAPVDWSSTGTITVTPTPDGRRARVYADSSTTDITATSGSATVTVSGS